mmetsp:Transcript_1314/g.2849  ORF Transcript_1314/g.2849 Transcript_1314/m.2849 type:complete len:146 (+) Transcript_1314:342-779(+)
MRLRGTRRLAGFGGAALVGSLPHLFGATLPHPGAGDRGGSTADSVVLGPLRLRRLLSARWSSAVGGELQGARPSRIVDGSLSGHANEVGGVIEGEWLSVWPGEAVLDFKRFVVESRSSQLRISPVVKPVKEVNVRLLPHTTWQRW